MRLPFSPPPPPLPQVCDFNLSRVVADEAQLANSGNPNSPVRPRSRLRAPACAALACCAGI